MIISQNFTGYPRGPAIRAITNEMAQLRLRWHETTQERRTQGGEDLRMQIIYQRERDLAARASVRQGHSNLNYFLTEMDDRDSRLRYKLRIKGGTSHLMQAMVDVAQALALNTSPQEDSRLVYHLCSHCYNLKIETCDVAIDRFMEIHDTSSCT